MRIWLSRHRVSGFAQMKCTCLRVHMWNSQGILTYWPWNDERAQGTKRRAKKTVFRQRKSAFRAPMDSLRSPYQVQNHWQVSTHHQPKTPQCAPALFGTQTVPYHHPALFQDFHGSVSLLSTNYLDNSEATTKEDTYNPNSSILTAWTCWGSFPSANNEHGKLGMIHVRCALSGVLGRYERNLSFYIAYWIKNKH